MIGWDRIARFMIEGAATDLEALRCPSCRGSLLFQYSPPEPRRKSPVLRGARVSVKCRSCLTGKSKEVASAPPWVKVLGIKHTTT